MWRALALFAALFLTAAPAAADQRDPRLDGLFAQLQTSSDPEQVKAATDAIRAIWLESPVPGAAESLQQGIFLASQGRLRDVVALFDRAIAAAPDFAEAHARRAALLADAGLFIPALADFEQTLKLEPRHFDALAGLGRIDLELGDTKGAVNALEQALAIHPHLIDVRASLEELKRTRGREEL